MELALYLPNFREKVTVTELEDLTQLAEDLDFESVWTLDRIIVPESSDRAEMEFAFGMMHELPKQLPVSSRGEFLQGFPLIPWLAAKTSKVRIGMSIIDTPYRSPGVLAAELATIDHLSNGRLNVAVGSGWMPEEFAAASASHIFPRRHQHLRETIEIMQGIWTNDVFEYHGEFADFGPSGFGAKPLQQPHPPIYFSGLKDAKRAAKRVAKYGLDGWIGIQDSPQEIAEWRKGIQNELDALDTSRTIDDLDIASMIWTVITDVDMDQTPAGKASNLLVGSEAQVTDMLKRYREAGLTKLLLWPPFADVPTPKTMDDMKRLKNDILPKIEAM
ncbi:MAG: LLM class flavin-dependent oxidoreductase [Gordonia sp.]|uniref:LLM class flavin-dependent oxidoreductase n=1 Tax=Gordonia rubripertincta TaxID=36822 RepID=A0ABT4MUX0_GORRU|nr:LLM class flavin-dependent oxidoreductase [Gordonia rubripertincta]MBA4020908.1 LLM class flavin-dependent oxidoreductase [Gordonia sp. (in: high G+C Gram-positive bacteria)]MCZ4550742.1 LLM class flavin-dependent oxidoreductase [Gordonia rubripertincta]